MLTFAVLFAYMSLFLHTTAVSMSEIRDKSVSETIDFATVPTKNLTGPASLSPMPSGYGGFIWTSVSAASVKSHNVAVVNKNTLGSVAPAPNPSVIVDSFAIKTFYAGCLGGPSADNLTPRDCTITMRGFNAAGMAVASEAFEYRRASWNGAAAYPGTLYTAPASFVGLVKMDARPVNAFGVKVLFGYCTQIQAVAQVRAA